jgi:NAD(P)-dependent dehydrogenase (short-subunit alcohol dehydrogenase family)
VSAAARVLVTGGSRGIGLEVAQRLAADGAQVIVGARTRPAVDAAVATLPGSGHTGLAIDVADPAAWTQAAEALAGVTGVVCAAGSLGPVGELADIEPDAFARTLQVNVVGTLLAIQACEPGLRAAAGAAVVFSGGGATGPFTRFDAYAASKAAVARLAENLATQGLRVNAVAPGFVRTAMQDEVLAAGPAKVGRAYHDRVQRAVTEDGFDDPTAAADLIAFLLSDAARGISGRLLSAIWDPWREPTFQARLRDEEDLATLRRIDDQFYTVVSRA